VTTTRRLPRRPSLILSVAQALALGLVLVVLVSGFAARTPARSENPSAIPLDLGAKDLQRAMTEHDCRTTGFGDTASPVSALIRHHGRLEHVSFERAWSVFTGEQPGELLAVCLSEARPAISVVPDDPGVNSPIRPPDRPGLPRRPVPSRARGEPAGPLQRAVGERTHPVL
jgi:hypothetical protein